MADFDFSTLSKSEKIDYIQALEEKIKRKDVEKLFEFEPYPWQANYYAAAKTAKQRLLMAANQVGKSETASQEMAYHLTGRYPKKWKGITFDHPITAWALGVTGDQIKRVIQKKLIGKYSAGQLDYSGCIPSVDIIEGSIVKSSQNRDLIKVVKIKHQSGGDSELSFLAYSQGQDILMGDIVDYIWIDEEPEDEEIYPQCLTRTANGAKGKGGYINMTFTPEHGMTSIIQQFTEQLQEGQFLMNVTWDDAPHISEETKAQLLSAYPEYQREMRSKGIPISGRGAVYPVNDADLRCDPFPLPEHFYVINGIDFGWDHPQANVQLWWDKDADTFYVAHVWSKKENDAVQAWSATKHFTCKYPVAWPQDGHQHEKGGGQQLQLQYRDAGFNMLAEHAKFPNGTNHVEPGITEILRAMRENRFKVFSHLHEWFMEKRLYHRDEHGKIIKKKDHIMDATRYAYMMRRCAKTASEMQHGVQGITFIPQAIKPIGQRRFH